MHEAFTNSSAATKTFFAPTSDDLLSPISVTNRAKVNDFSWVNESNPDVVSLENWHLSQPEEISVTNLPSSFRASSKLTYTQKMDSADNWRIVESEPNGWGDLADEIGRLNIGAVGDQDDGIRTPPKSKLTATTVAKYAEASPLDTSSSTSVDSSPNASDHQISVNHSRNSSIDTSSHDSVPPPVNTFFAHSSLKSGSSAELKERPHSFSGGLSSADLRRLQHAGEGSESSEGPLQQQQQQWLQDNVVANNKQLSAEQVSYPSLANTVPAQRPSPSQSNAYDYRGGVPSVNALNRDDVQLDYNVQQQQQRPFNPPNPANPVAAPGPGAPSFVPGRPTNLTAMPYRQPRFPGPQQPVPLSPTAMAYGPPQHTAHLSLGNSQQVYDMMLPDAISSAVSRVQQQHNVFRPTHHQHSASDPSTARDVTTMAMLNNSMQGFPPNMFPGMAAPAPQAMAMYPNQYYGAQDAFNRPDAAVVAAAAQAQALAALRLQQQYSTSYALHTPPLDGSIPSPTSTATGQTGPSANNRKLGLYKTELCRSWEEKGSCRYGAKCQFAHGEEELRKVARHPKYKTEICRTFWVSGSCPYGKRCCFIHTELPAAGSQGGVAPSDSVPPTAQPDGRARSMSTNSDPNDASVSLLQRISAKRNQEASTGSNSSSTPIEVTPTSAVPFSSRPPTGSLRVDTSVDNGISKQNKSAYPTFTSNGVLLGNTDPLTAKSPVPVTAGPDFGRQHASRLEIVGYNARGGKAATPPSNATPRHTSNGSEDYGFSPSPPAAGHAYTLSGDANSNAGGRVNGHVRGSSAGNWGSLPRGSHLASSYPHAASPADAISSPWSTTELAVGSSRLNEKAWA